MEGMHDESFFVITGGPGAGKSTLLDALGGRGHACVPEVARGIIQEQMLTGGDALPWGDVARYRDMMLVRSIETYDAAVGGAAITFFDRGVVDVLGYTRVIGLPIDEALMSAARDRRYNATVFILPPWEAIYRNDAERKQTFEESIDVHEALVEVYRLCGYDLLEVPRESLESRADFILAEAARLLDGARGNDHHPHSAS